MTVRVGVLGANGQIGGALCAKAGATAGLQCVAIVRNRFTAAMVNARAGAVETRIGSITDSAQAAALIGDCEVVVNCVFATGGGIAASRRANDQLFDSIRRVAPRARLIHLSSVAVYGLQKTEGQRRLVSTYNREKLRHERYLQSTFPTDRLIIVRVGHVYGRETPISRFMLDCHLDPAFRLPIDVGASNAVSLDRLVAVLVEACLHDEVHGVYDAVDEPNATWRQQFDAHAAAFELPPVGSVASSDNPVASAARSILAALFARPDLRKLSSHVALRSALDWTLARAPRELEALVRRWYRQRIVAEQVGGTRDARRTPIPEWLYFPAATAGNLPRGTEDAWASRGQAALREWSRRVRDPRWSWEDARDLPVADRPARASS